MLTDPLTGARKPEMSDGPLGGLQVANAVDDLSSYTVPRFTTTTERDADYAAFVTAGGTMADGMLCTAAGVPYRRINGTWRQDNGPRIITRFTNPSSAISSGGGNQTGVTSGIPALASFTLYEAATVAMMATFRGGGAGALEGFVLINGAQVGDKGVTRSDVTATVVGAVALAAGTHTIAMHVDASGGAITWVSGRLVLTVGIAE